MSKLTRLPLAVVTLALIGAAQPAAAGIAINGQVCRRALSTRAGRLISRTNQLQPLSSV